MFLSLPLWHLIIRGTLAPPLCKACVLVLPAPIFNVAYHLLHIWVSLAFFFHLQEEVCPAQLLSCAPACWLCLPHMASAPTNLWSQSLLPKQSGECVCFSCVLHAVIVPCKQLVAATCALTSCSQRHKLQIKSVCLHRKAIGLPLCCTKSLPAN